VMPSSDVFVSFSRLKTASSQGISLYPAKYDWELCPILALAVCFITSEFPSEFVFNHLSLHELKSEVDPKLGVVSQLEGTVYGVTDESSQAESTTMKNGRKRPSAAQFTNTKVQQLQKEYITQNDVIGSEHLTKDLQSHSLRRGAAQHVNSCSKIPIQWLCTRGNWVMDSLIKRLHILELR
jgi:hypothetical protein